MKRTRTWFRRTSAVPPEVQPGVQQVKDWVLWGAMACAMVSTAHAEWSLAVAAHWNPYVAATLPGALDLYVVRALQVSRDVLPAVLVAVLANVAAHLVQAGEVPVDWRLVSAVGAMTPLVLWRVQYLMRYGRGRSRKEILWDVPAGVQDVAERTSAVPAQVSEEVEFHDDPLTIPEWVQRGVRDEYASGEVNAPEVQDEYGNERDGCTECGQPYPCTHDIEDASTAYLPTVPLPEGWTRQVYPEHLDKGDAEYIPHLRAYLDTCEEECKRPSIRGVKDSLGVAQARATRLLRYMGYPTSVSKEDS